MFKGLNKFKKVAFYKTSPVYYHDNNYMKKLTSYKKSCKDCVPNSNVSVEKEIKL